MSFQTTVILSNAPETRNLPIVVNLHVRGWENHPQTFAGLHTTEGDPDPAGHILRMAYPAGEGPSAIDDIPVAFGHGDASGQEDSCSLGRAATHEHLLNRLVGQESAPRAHRRGADHGAPRRRGVDAGQRLNDLQLGHRIRLGPAKLGRELKSQ